MTRSAALSVVLLAGYSFAGEPSHRSTQAPGPLRAHPTNPRYFTDGTKTTAGAWKAVYLTGSHTWANLIDRGESDPPPAFDFDGYLNFLQKRRHNFIRLWSRHVSWYQEYGERPLFASPLPWPRTGPGTALDGKPKFDLTEFDPAYFDRLRSRVQAAGDRGIYVSIMLFGGYQEAGPNWTGNPFHRDNNASGIDGDPNQDGRGWETQTLAEIPKPVVEVQKGYIRKVVDTVNDLDNVLFEIANEGPESSQDWQYDLIQFIKDYEKTKSKQHPVGMTAAYWPVEDNRARLDASPADWVSYLFEMKPAQGREAYDVNDPFIADARKVSIQDSDHWWVVPIYGDARFGRDWVWKGFCRGHQPILMEHLPPRSFVARDHPLTPDDAGYVAARTAMGQTRAYAERMDLGAAAPSKEIASTGFCLVVLGKEYLVYLPAGGDVTVDLSAAKGELAVEWFDVAEGESVAAGVVRGGDRRSFQAPFRGPAVLYLAAGR
jgi:hypothetical protein